MNRDDIINKKFPHAFWGYDAVEVDLFLDEVIRELDRLHNELDIASLGAEAARQREERLKLRADKLRQLLIDHGVTDTGAQDGEGVQPDGTDEQQSAEPDGEQHGGCAF